MEDKKKRQPGPRIEVYFDQKEIDKRINGMYVIMLRGVSKMLETWGDLECKGGGQIDPTEALFHCRACTFNGIRHHVDQAIERWKDKT
jgi:hypothetical protein